MHDQQLIAEIKGDTYNNAWIDEGQTALGLLKVIRKILDIAI